MGWDQFVADPSRLAAYLFVAYVDGNRMPLPDARCDAGTAPTQFVCSAQLPSMTVGAHTLELAAVDTTDGGQDESPRSGALNLNVSGVKSLGPRADANAPKQPQATAIDGVPAMVEILATGFTAPSALAATPDGRLVVAQRSGAIWIWDRGAIGAVPALQLTDAARGSNAGLVGLAVAPAFADTRNVFVAYTAQVSNHAYVNRVLRYRELNGSLGAGVVLLEDPVNAPPPSAARVRFGPDRKLYVAFAALSSQAALDLATYSGKLLRLNEDGTTPRDNPAASPILSSGHPDVGGFDWQTGTGKLWLAERSLDRRDRLVAVSAGGRATPMYTFASSVAPSALTFYSNQAVRALNGTAFISALDAAAVEKVRVDPTTGLAVAADPLFSGQFGRISDIVEGADGNLYFCTSNGADGGDQLLRITPRVAAAAR